MYSGYLTRGPVQPVPEVKPEAIDRLEELARHPDRLVAEQAERILRWIREAGL